MKSEELLNDFTTYCRDHPEQRFWQALRNWADYPFILAADGMYEAWKDIKDTFYFNERHQ